MTSPARSTQIQARQLDERVGRRLMGMLRGQVIRPQDVEYAAARHIWNGMIEKHPALIARCTGIADVRACIRFAREHALPVAIRGGGHNVAGTALCDDGLVIDLSRMKGIHVDAVRRTARMQPGVTNGDLDSETQAYSLATTTGIASTTGVGGLTLGGGIGWLMRKHGLTCDNLLSADVITANGDVLSASAEQHADLFWAVRGGGGNFGVVTSFEYALYPLGPQVLAGLLMYPAAQGDGVLRHYRDFLTTAPDELGVMLNLRYAPPASWVPQPLHGKPVVAIVVIYAGPVEEGLRALRPLREYGQPLLDIIEPRPYVQHQSMYDGAVPPGLRYYWKSHYLGEMSDDTIAILLDHAWRDSSRQSYTLVMRMGGAVTRMGEEETACGNRRAQHALNINGVWSQPGEDDEHIAWARDFFEAAQPASTGGVYVNFLGNEGEARIRAAYGVNYERLVAVKGRYDPENFFCVNQNIPPSR